MSEEQNKKGLIEDAPEQITARLRGQSVAANMAEYREAREELSKVVAAMKWDENAQMYDVSEGVEGFGSAAEAKQRIATLNMTMEQINEINASKLEAQHLNKQVNSEPVGPEQVQEQVRAAADGTPQFRNTQDFLEKMYGTESPTPEQLQNARRNNGTLRIEGAWIQDFYNVMNSGQGGATPPTGITPDKPVSPEAVLAALPLRNSILPLIPQYPAAATGTYTYLAEAEAGVPARAAGYGVAEGAIIPSQDVGAKTRTATVVKRGLISTITSEQQEDVQQSYSFWVNTAMRLIGEDLSKQIVQGNGNTAVAGHTALDLNGLLGSTSAPKGQTGTLNYARTDRSENPILKFWLDALKRFEAPRGTGYGGMPTHIILPNDNWYDVLGAQDTTNNYIAIDAILGSTNVDRLWGIPVIRSDYMEANTGMITAFSPDNFGIIFNRGIDMTFGNASQDFEKDQSSLRILYRAQVVVKRPKSIMKCPTLNGTSD